MRRLALLLAACGGSSSPPPPTGPIAAHVTHYDYTFDLDSRAAHATVTAVVDTAGDCYALPFRAASPDQTTLMFDGAPATGGSIMNNTMTLCGPGSQVGDTITLDADESVAKATLGPSQVGYSLQNDSDGHPFYYLVSWVNGCDQFGPCDSQPDVFATYTFHVTHMAGVTVRCPGDITEVSATQTDCDFEHMGGPTYSTFGIAASSGWTQTDKGMFGDVHVTVYDRASTGIAAAIDTAYHDGYIQFMESTFGAFPYGTELRVLTAPTYWNGFEHPGNIVLADSLAHQFRPPYADNVAHTLDHEMTHMWAGDQTTIATTYDFAWKESMAEYLPFTYEDSTGGATVSSRTAGSWKVFANGATYFPVPDDMPALIDYYGDVYGAGPMILFRQVEAMSSREAVIAALKTLLGTPHAISVDDVIAALSASTGIDLTQYGHDWLHGTGKPDWPRMQVTFTAPDQLAIAQTNASGVHGGCKFHVALVGANPGESQEVAVDTFHDGSTQTITVSPAPTFTVTQTQLDPESECLVFPATASPSPRVNPWVAP